MPRTVIIDADVIGHINRGSNKAAQALKTLIQSGATVYVSQQAYNELATDRGTVSADVGQDLPRYAAANRKLLDDLGIKVAPAGKLADRFPVLDRNSATSNLSQEDMMHAAQARALNAELWSFDKAFRKDPNRVAKAFNVKVAPESQIAFAEPAKREDYRVARSLMGLAPVEITVSGQIIKPAPKKPPSGSGGQGGPSGDSGRPGTKAVVGMPDTGPVDIGPSATRGEKIGNAIELGLSGYNFVIQKINDSIQAKRVMEQWARVKPNIERHLAEDPTLGALVLVRFGRRQKQGPEHDSPLEHTNQFLSIEVSYGATESEAWENYKMQPRLSPGAGLDVSVQRAFIQPKKPVDIRALRTPFTSYGVGTFVPGRASLMQVAWKGVFGFDEIGDVKVDVPENETPRFLLMVAPNEISWFNGPNRHTSEVPVDWRAAASAAIHLTQHISVVDMDRGLFNAGADTAAMVFPADAATERLFAGAGETKDNTNQLRTYVNFDKLRWVRPKNIHVLRKFMEEDEVSGDKPVRFAPKESPIMR